MITNHRLMVCSAALFATVVCYPIWQAPGAEEHAPTNSISTNQPEWIRTLDEEYRLSFLRPPDSELSTRGSCIFGIYAEGLRRSPLEIQMMPEQDAQMVGGVFHHYSIRLVFVTPATELRQTYAKLYGWTERPRTDLVPFEFTRDKDALLKAVEQLYLGIPVKWERVDSTQVANKPGAFLSGWAYRLGYKPEERFFHEVVAVPLDGGRIFLVQACMARIKSESDLGNRRALFDQLVKSIVLDTNSPTTPPLSK